jgi:hypothetical protein
MNRPIKARLLVVALLFSAVAAHAQAPSEVGTVAAVVGRLEIERGGSWRDANVGAAVFVGDRLRTGAKDRGKVVFADDSVLDVGSDTEITIDKLVFDPPAHRFQSLLRLAKGRIRAWVSEYYQEPRARYEVETPTAIAGVRGTEFIVIFNLGTSSTEIIGISNAVEVTGKLGVIGNAVQIGPRQYTQVQKGRFPAPPQRLDEIRFHEYLQELEIVGTGRRDGLNVLHPAVVGQLLSPQDMPEAPAAPAGSAPVQGLLVGAPDEGLVGRLSPDVHANTQPLLDFKSTPAGQVPGGTGGVRVGF